jgi:hypothetical protein
MHEWMDWKWKRLTKGWLTIGMSNSHKWQKFRNPSVHCNHWPLGGARIERSEISCNICYNMQTLYHVDCHICNDQLCRDQCTLVAWSSIFSTRFLNNILVPSKPSSCSHFLLLPLFESVRPLHVLDGIPNRIKCNLCSFFRRFS